MSETLWAAAIVAGGTIAAALIARFRWPLRKLGLVDRPSPVDSFMLGAYVSKIVWGKFGMMADQAVTRISIPVLYDRVGISETLRAEFEKIISDVETSGAPKDVVPHLRQLFGVYISTAFGNRKGQFFALGFDSIGLLAHVDVASVLPDGPKLLASRIEAIIRDAEKLKCPVSDYKKLLPMVRKGFSGYESPLVLDLRSKLLEAGTAMHDHLSKNAATVEAGEVRQLRELVHRTR